MSRYKYQSVILTNRNDSGDKNNELIYKLPYPIELKKSEICLASGFLYYSWPNIAASYNNHQVSYIWVDATEHTITFPDGFYDIQNINGYIMFIMRQNGHYLVDENGADYYFFDIVSNNVYYRYTLISKLVPSSLPSGWSNPSGFTLPLTDVTPTFKVLNNEFSRTIGFPPGNVGPFPLEFRTNGQNAPQISFTTAVSLDCNLTSASMFNSSPSTIYTFSPNVQYGSQIIIEPHELVWYKCIDSAFSEIKITLTDQDNKDVPMEDNNQLYTLYIRTEI